MELTVPFDYQAIERILPHRYPFLLVDRITEFEVDTRVVGVKNVTGDESYLSRVHGQPPVLPPTILTEAVAQVGAILILAKPENREKLVTLLTYHVVPGRVTAAQARTLSSAETVAGQKVQLRDVDGELRVNNAVVRIADVPASNGLVHVIDRVLMPQAPPCENGSTSRRGAFLN